jgi:vacuolar-type H+-ATPase subunit E/Vma4
MKETDGTTRQTPKDDIRDDSGLLDQVLKEAEAQARKLVDEAESQAEKKRENSKKTCDSIAAEAEKRTAEQLDHYCRQKEASFKIELKKLDLQVYEQSYARVMKKVRTILNEMADKKEYREFLIAMIAEGALGLGEEDIEIIAGEKERKHIDEKLLAESAAVVRKYSGASANLSLSSESLGSQGVVLSAKNGRLIFNNRIEARLNRRQNEIRRLISDEIDFSGNSKGATA